MMLADMGARVIKVESPGRGDESRSWGPPFVGPADAPVSTYFLSANRNKESIQLDLKTEGGLVVLEDLVRRADVLVENFRPGVLDRLGLPTQRMRELNSRLVVLSITGFGHDGPEGDRAGYDQIAQGEAGLMSLTGPSADEPTRVGVPIGDLLAGMYGAFGVAAALAERERSGQGKVVRTSLLAAVVGVHAFQGTRYTVGGEVPQPSGNHHPAIAPYGAFRALDGILQVAIGNDVQWRTFADLLGLSPAEARFATNTSRVQHRTELIREMEDALSAASVETWLGRLHDAGVPAGKVRSLDDVYAWEQTLSQGLLIEVDHPTVGQVRLPGPPLRLENLDGSRAGRTAHAAPPLLGEHDEAVRCWLEADRR
jgi:formyl-CoA transferase